jgi:hypothetical protein
MKLTLAWTACATAHALLAPVTGRTARPECHAGVTFGNAREQFGFFQGLGPGPIATPKTLERLWKAPSRRRSKAREITRPVRAPGARYRWFSPFATDRPVDSRKCLTIPTYRTTVGNMGLAIRPSGSMMSHGRVYRESKHPTFQGATGD